MSPLHLPIRSLFGSLLFDSSVSLVSRRSALKPFYMSRTENTRPWMTSCTAGQCCSYLPPQTAPNWEGKAPWAILMSFWLNRLWLSGLTNQVLDWRMSLSQHWSQQVFEISLLSGNRGVLNEYLVEMDHMKEKPKVELTLVPGAKFMV